MKLSHSQAVATMVAVALMWSIAGVVTRHLEHARSFEITFWRSFFTVLSLVVILPVWRGRKALTELPWRSGLFWLSGVCWAVMFTAFMLALTLTTVANVLVTTCSPGFHWSQNSATYLACHWCRGIRDCVHVRRPAGSGHQRDRHPAGTGCTGFRRGPIGPSRSTHMHRGTMST
jgi:hypothetical protein